MDLTYYEVHGINPKTKRSNKRTIIALDEEAAIKQMESDGFVEPFEVAPQRNDPATRKQIDYARDLGIPIPMNATLMEMSRRISAAVDSDVNFSKFHPIVGKGWYGWPRSIHHEKVQIARQERAKSAQYEPIELSASKQAALFARSGEGNPYVTTLEDCHCLDFYRTGKPCKHMYRLAYELGMHDLTSMETVDVNIKEELQKAFSGIKIPVWLIHVLLALTTWGIGNIIYILVKARGRKS